MNINAILIGLLVAIVIIKLFNVDKENDVQSLYSLYLANFPLYYGLFSLYVDSYLSLYQELLMGIPFILIAGICYKINNRATLMLLASAYVLQASYVITHASLLTNPGIPLWWPEFSGTINLILGIYLLGLIQARHHQHIDNQAYENFR